MLRTVTWFAPGRVNLIGEHTDYNDGLALPFALERGCTATVIRTNSPGITITSEQKSTAVRLGPDDLALGSPWLHSSASWAGYAAGALWVAASRWGHDILRSGWQIELSSSLPIGAGLSSSAAVCCAVAGAVADVLENPIDADTIAELATTAEQDFVNAPTGGMDQLAVAHGRDDHAVLCDMRDRSTAPIPLHLATAGLSILVVDTGSAHTHVNGEYTERRTSCHRAAALLGLNSLRDATLLDLERLDDERLVRRARHVITENQRVLAAAHLLDAGDVAGIAPLLNSSHDSMRDDFEITVERVDIAATALREGGALGARMTGGGFGGCVIGLVPLADLASAEDAVQAAFAAGGLGSPSIFAAHPSRGAHRTR